MGQDIVIMAVDYRRGAEQGSFVASEEGNVVGRLDLYHCDRIEERAAVGIFVEESLRGRGYGKRILAAFIVYCRDILHLHQIYCDISLSNTPSLHLFSSLGFVRCGVLKEWSSTPSGWEDACRMQLILQHTS